MFAVSSMALFIAAGGAIDLARVYTAKQKLSQNATLACQYASRPSIVDTSTASYSGSNGGTTYSTNVNSFITQNLAAQKFAYTQTTGTPFTYTQNGPANVTLTANVPTTLMQIIHITQIPVSATSHCYDSPTSIPQRVANNSNTFIVNESFEATTCGGTCFAFYNPSGGSTTIAAPTSTPGTTVGYTGANGNQWIITGYCIEIDSVGLIKGTVPDGFHSAELDCDNGSGSAGNSSISTKQYLAAGNYELRYNYTSRVDYPNYDPLYLCGTSAQDVAWANDTTTSGFASALRTNQINAYLDVNTNGVPPTHTTLDGSQTLAGSNLIDVCVYSQNWIERSVRIKVTTAGYYWLSFAADGASDSYGGQLDNVRLCIQTCPNALQDDFPTAWLPSGSVNKVLFEDTFETPVYASDPFVTSAHAKAGNPALNLGTSGTAASGWPSQASSGWATAPYNNVVYWMQGAYQGNQYFSLQGWNGVTNASDPINRATSRKFLLVPGYYNVSYAYTSQVDFSYDFVYNNNYYPVCTSNPTTVNGLTTYGMKHGYDYGSTTLLSQYLSTNFMYVYFSNGQLVSTPTVNTTSGGAPTYNNPNGTTSSSPTVPIDNGSNFAAYNASAPNPVIDACYYSSAHGWAQRSLNVKITKPGWYWLTFSAEGDPLTGTGGGPAIDDVKLTALGGPYMSSPPTTALTVIPVVAPQPDTQFTNSGQFSGFFIVADPFQPPSPLQ